MNKSNFLWLRASIFYANHSFNQLISDCIIPLLDILKNQSILIERKFFIEFNNEKGSNIRLSIALRKKGFKKNAEYIDRYINQFLLSTPSLNSSNVFSASRSLFKPFNNNSLQYNLYDFDCFYETDFDNKFIIRLRSDFSFFFIQHFGLSTTEFNNNIELLIIFNLLLLKTIILDLENNDHEDYVDMLIAKYQTKESSQILNLNKNTIKAIQDNIEILFNKNFDPTQFEEEWITGWIEIAYSVLNDYKKESMEDYYNFFNLVADNICSQLDVSLDVSIEINKFLLKTFKDFRH